MRACDVCRRRKQRCVSFTSVDCVVCHGLGVGPCTFDEPPPPKRRKQQQPAAYEPQSPPTVQHSPPRHRSLTSTEAPVSAVESASPTASYPSPQSQRGDTWPDDSLLAGTLGLEKCLFTRHVGPSGDHDWYLLSKSHGRARPHYRKVQDRVLFEINADECIPTLPHVEDDPLLDRIETLIQPHGPALVGLYFRIIHPSYPVLQKDVFLEKYNRTYREISPHLLAAVYALALGWRSYDATLMLCKSIDAEALIELAHAAVQDSIKRPRLGTIQAGLLLLNRPPAPFVPDSAWRTSFLGAMLGIAQHLGLHLDCAGWKIPTWEKGLRRRLAWALLQQDSFAAMTWGRPLLAKTTDWDLKPLIIGDFLETGQEQPIHGGSADLDTGNTNFIAICELSESVRRIQNELYGPRIKMNTMDQVLDAAKPIGRSLSDLLKSLPPALALDTVQSEQLCISGFYHLAHHAATACMQRRILWALEDELASGSAIKPDAAFVSFLRSTLVQRARSIVEFFINLQPEHFEAFWPPFAGGCATTLGCFLGLLRVTSQHPDEAKEIAVLMRALEWQFRVNAKMAEWLEYALLRLKSLGWHDWLHSSENIAEK